MPLRVAGPSPVGRMAALTASASQVKLRHRARVKTLPSRRVWGRSNQARGVIRCSAGFIESYELALEASPLLVKSTTSLVGFLVADLVAQGLSSSRREDGDGRGIDLTRSGRNALFGFALYGPCSSWWYGLLDQYVLPEDPTSALAVAAKVAADQVAWAPVLVDHAVRVGPSVERGQRGGWRVAEEAWQTCSTL